MLPKKSTVVLLRWVLIIASSYLMLLDSRTGRVDTRLALLIAVALGSNLLVARIPVPWTESRVFDFAIVVFDASWVTLGLLWAPSVSGDLFLLYFLVIFVAAMGESLPMIVGSAALVSVVYGATLSFQPGGDFRLTTTALLRVPFLFVVALFYGYFVTQIRGRRNEAAEARLREQAKTELLAAVSHDLRGPLGNAENFLTLVLDAQAASKAVDRDLLLRAQMNVHQVSSLVSNLLHAACIEAGQVRFQFAPVQVNDIVEEVFALESGAATLKHLVLSKELDPTLPKITADHMQLGRILTNLVNNAIKYTKVGGVTVRTEYDESTLRVSVRDSGPGMDAPQREALFAPYRRVHLRGYTPGTGLGLYIAKKLVEAQEGTVEVSSEPGVGSTFVVSLPRVRRNEPAPNVSRLPERPLGADAQIVDVSIQAA